MRSKFGLRTILIPIFAVIGFYMVQILVSIVYLLILFFASSFTADGFDPSKMDLLMKDVNTLLMQQSNNISGIYSVLIIAIALLVIRALTRSNPLAIRHERTNAGQWTAAVLLILGSAGIVTLLMIGIQELAKAVPAIQTAMDNYINLSKNFIGSGNIPVVILTTCIAVPIAEDLVFRGIIQGELRRVMPGWTAVLIQGVIFALVHGDPIQISYVIIPAIILGAAYEWTKSIYVPIAMHMVFNLAGSVIPMMLGNSETAGGIFATAEIAMIPFAVIALVFLYKRRHKDPDPDAFAAENIVPDGAASAASAVLASPPVPDGNWKHRDSEL